MELSDALINAFVYALENIALLLMEMKTSAAE